MILSVPCASASANPDPISRPRGSSNVCIDVVCSGRTTISVTYTIVNSTVTFSDGTQTAGPFQQICETGTTRVCRVLDFTAAAGEAMFPLRIAVSEVGVPDVFLCTINIQVH